MIAWIIQTTGKIVGRQCLWHLKWGFRCQKPGWVLTTGTTGWAATLTHCLLTLYTTSKMFVHLGYDSLKENYQETKKNIKKKSWYWRDMEGKTEMDNEGRCITRSHEPGPIIHPWYCLLYSAISIPATMSVWCFFTNTGWKVNLTRFPLVTFLEEIKNKKTNLHIYCYNLCNNSAPHSYSSR